MILYQRVKLSEYVCTYPPMAMGSVPSRNNDSFFENTVVICGRIVKRTSEPGKSFIILSAGKVVVSEYKLIQLGQISNSTKSAFSNISDLTNLLQG